MIHIHVLFFASFQAATGKKKIEIDIVDGSKVSDLIQQLGAIFPSLNPGLTLALVAINQEYTAQDVPIMDGSEVAIFPPVSGGSSPVTITKIVTEPLDITQLTEQITFPSTGAICAFTGIVRALTDQNSLRETSFLEYEAYIPMAETKLNQIACEIRDRWPSVEGIIIVQRIGKLFPSTPTVLVACSAAHRNTGVFDAARYGIDRLKEIVPVWKKETGSKGEFWVEGNFHPKSGD